MAGSETSNKIDPTSPYYVGIQDRSTDLITTVRLKLDNFDDWAHAIRHALRSRRKFGFLDGTYTAPQPPCTAEDWDTLQSLLITWLNNTLSPEVRSLLSKYDDAKTMWDDINAQFNVSDGPRLYQVKAKLYDCRQKEGMSVATYFSKLCQLWDELDKLEPIITSKVDPEVGKEHLLRRSKDRLHLFLFGLLPVPYHTTRSVILTQKPPPDVSEAFQLILQEERVHGFGTNTSHSTDLATFAVRSAPRPALRPSSTLSRTERRNLICTHCSRKGHDRSMCFELLDEIPDWWYELKGLPKPSKGTSSRASGGATAAGTAAKGGRGGGKQKSDRAQPPATTTVDSANVVTTAPVDGESSAVTVYGVSHHHFAGPSYEGGDWTG